MMDGFRVGIVGATGAVGREVVKILKERRFPAADVRLIASGRSAGTRIGDTIVEAISEEVLKDLDAAIFDTPDEIATRWVPVAASLGVTVIDNSAAFRMEPDVPLVIPEINADALRQARRRIIANPNCTTATIAMPLAPLHKAAKLRRVFACSYQAVSGAGQKGVEQLWTELGEAVASHQPPVAPRGDAFAHPIALNLIPAIGSWKGDHTSEEVKVASELRKMLDAPELRAGITCVRIPTLVGHGVAVHAEFERPMDPSTARRILDRAPGIDVIDDPRTNRYPTTLQAAGRDPCYVGRIREDGAGALAFFAIADNLRKGAALNTIQIAETLIRMGLLAPRVRA
ncbi:MAG: aspartate-semialdehyde dehydrogenase [Armatimonadetes bacterium]|nr:aspartate-semialdehyde dehydrogenase [Armatimonadota bacterium]